MELKFTLCQRFQSLKNYINTELRGILAAYPGETEQLANEIDSLASYIKDNLKCNGSNAAQDEFSAASIHSENARSEHRSDENGQNQEPPMQSLSLIYDHNSAAEKQDAVEAASERISLEMERENMNELLGQDIREQGERGAASADGAWEEQESERRSEEEPQAQSSGKAATSEHVRQRNSVTHAQASTASASSGKSKRNRVVNSTGGSSSKRQRRSMTADVEEFKRKDISAFFKQTALIPKDFHQPEEIYGIFSERCSTDDPATIWLLTRLFFGTGSTNSFDQLSKICTTLRQNQNLPTPRATNSLRQVVQALDSLDVQFSVASILRLYFLVSAKTYRIKLEEEHQHSPSVRIRKVPKRLATSSEDRQSQTISTFDRADTQALRKMMEEAYPDLQSTRRIRGGAEVQAPLSPPASIIPGAKRHHSVRRPTTNRRRLLRNGNGNEDKRSKDVCLLEPKELPPSERLQTSPSNCIDKRKSHQAPASANALIMFIGNGRGTVPSQYLLIAGRAVRHEHYD
ncbi:MAG: hypothetical protein Q9201_007227 [Fulgogasparrea decipioides]